MSACPLQVVSKLHQILKPFLLRRVKTDVETSLPGKMEVILYAGMTERQRELNQQLRDKTLNVSGPEEGNWLLDVACCAVVWPAGCWG
jgi:ATP-dependent DNA helicase